MGRRPAGRLATVESFSNEGFTQRVNAFTLRGIVVAHAKHRNGGTTPSAGPKPFKINEGQGWQTECTLPLREIMNQTSLDSGLHGGTVCTSA